MHIDGNVKFQIKPDPQDADAVLHLVTLCSICTYGTSCSLDVIGWQFCLEQRPN
ncbi:hypothetical protein SAMD00023353_5500340 [Rosellinia necatrix]|uniref:Uncharacterized protein n=1 Tax=Rosellinia necatrix TaxID=77044 RepID=A0A1W2TQV8_ROSNE|nr:hypothetical protein SAMD00023353_5500340 [Rosellinia necatrix]